MLEETPGLLIELLTIPHCRYFLVAAELGEKLLSTDSVAKGGNNGSGWYSLLHPEARLARLPAARQENLRMFGLRVMQVMRILENLSMEQANYKLMAECQACLRFLVRGVASSNAGVHAQQPVFDELAVLDQHKMVLEGQALATLANISPWIDVEELDGKGFVKAYLGSRFCSPDRAVLVGALNMFSRLCMLADNKAWVLELIDANVGRFVQLLAFNDTQVLFATLEVLYQLTLWKDTAVLVAKTDHCIKTLIAMLDYHLDTLEDRPDTIAADITSSTTGSVAAWPGNSTAAALVELPVALCSKPRRNFRAVLRTAELWWRSNYEAAPDEREKCVVRGEVYDLYVKARKGEPTLDRAAFGDVARICFPDMEEVVVPETLGRQVIYLGVKARSPALSKSEAWQASEIHREEKLPFVPSLLKPHQPQAAFLAGCLTDSAGAGAGAAAGGSVSDIRSYFTPEMMSAASAMLAKAATGGGSAASSAQAMAAAMLGMEEKAGGALVAQLSGGGGAAVGRRAPVVLSVPAPKPVKLAVPAPKPVKISIPAKKQKSRIPICDGCGVEFARPDSLRRHMANSCPKRAMPVKLKVTASLSPLQSSISPKKVAPSPAHAAAAAAMSPATAETRTRVAEVSAAARPTAMSFPPSFAAPVAHSATDPFEPVVRHALDMRTTSAASAAPAAAPPAHMSGFNNILPQLDGPDDEDVDMGSAGDGPVSPKDGTEAAQRSAKRARSDEPSPRPTSGDGHAAASVVSNEKFGPTGGAAEVDNDADYADDAGPAKKPRSDGTASEAGLKANGKAKTEPKPTDALMVKQWSSRNPVEIPNYPRLDEEETEHAYLLSEISVQQGEAAASLSKMKERTGHVWAFDFGQDNATVAGIRFAAALVLRNLARSPGNKVLFAPFESALLQAAVKDAPEKSVLASCLLGFT